MLISPYGDISSHLISFLSFLSQLVFNVPEQRNEIIGNGTQLIVQGLVQGNRNFFVSHR